ncbi:hypothetical protein T492DRAFT_382701 [Pavlovales sp. CCMP2436]|nr:hypothetical protein T492DRAFT_382701 [Pavlovales sp. CCMP2436]
MSDGPASGCSPSAHPATQPSSAAPTGAAPPPQQKVVVVVALSLTAAGVRAHRRGGARAAPRRPVGSSGVLGPVVVAQRLEVGARPAAVRLGRIRARRPRRGRGRRADASALPRTARLEEDRRARGRARGGHTEGLVVVPRLGGGRAQRVAQQLHEGVEVLLGGARRGGVLPLTAEAGVERGERAARGLKEDEEEELSSL